MRHITTLLLSACLLVAAGLAQAELRLPMVFDVQAVAADDVLNVRAEPSAAARVLTTLAPSTKGIEVIGLSEDGKWGQISTGEGNGWVAMRFLVAQHPAGALAGELTCFGTEPFWRLAVSPQSLRWKPMDGAEQKLELAEWIAADGGYFAASDADAQTKAQLIVSPEQCSDGMSDRAYGYAVRVILSQGKAASLLRGCCTLDQR